MGCSVEKYATEILDNGTVICQKCSDVVERCHSCFPNDTRVVCHNCTSGWRLDDRENRCIEEIGAALPGWAVAVVVVVVVVIVVLLFVVACLGFYFWRSRKMKSPDHVYVNQTNRMPLKNQPSSSPKTEAYTTLNLDVQSDEHDYEELANTLAYVNLTKK